MKKSRAFEMEPVTLPVDKILATRKLTPAIKESKRYKVIAASVAEVGIIEPLVVHPAKGAKGSYLLLDGHSRLEVLKERGAKEVTCLVSTEDEAFTYNHKVNRLAPIQTNRMLKKALDAGVSPERIAKALNVKPETIVQHRSMLQGICDDAIDMLKDKPIGEVALRYFKWMKPYRQVEMAELMNNAGNYTVSYAKALVSVTPRDQFLDPDAREKKVTTPESLAQMENEIVSLEREFRMLDQSHARDELHLTVIRAYLKKLLENGKVTRFLSEGVPQAHRASLRDPGEVVSRRNISVDIA